MPTTRHQPYLRGALIRGQDEEEIRAINKARSEKEAADDADIQHDTDT